MSQCVWLSSPNLSVCLPRVSLCSPRLSLCSCVCVCACACACVCVRVRVRVCVCVRTHTHTHTLFLLSSTCLNTRRQLARDKMARRLRPEFGVPGGQYLLHIAGPSFQWRERFLPKLLSSQSSGGLHMLSMRPPCPRRTLSITLTYNHCQSSRPALRSP